MGSLTCLTDPAALVVLDTSTAINLNATGCASQILQALSHSIVAVDSVQAELEQGSRRGWCDAELFNGLVSEGLIGVVLLGDQASQHFEGLVIGPASETLDDGEAATIAYAVEHGAIALIDERKANRICAAKFPDLRLGCTTDLFTHPDVLHALGRGRLAEAVVNALQYARMRVLPHHVEWVIDLIGPERVAQCNSLSRSARTRNTLVVNQ